MNRLGMLVDISHVNDYAMMDTLDITLAPGKYIPASLYNTRLKNIKNVKGCRDGMPKSMQTR